MNIIIAGSREFDDYEYLKEAMDEIIAELDDGTKISIVCGMARGADLLGKQYAEDRWLAVIEMPADWDQYGKKAGHIRNEEMAKIGDVLVAFWIPPSPGTKNMIGLAEKYKLKISVHEVS